MGGHQLGPVILSRLRLVQSVGYLTLSIGFGNTVYFETL